MDDVAAAAVSIENVWLVVPEGTVTVVGTVATGLLLARTTTAPDAGAAADSVTVPVTLSPPAMVWLDKDTDSSVAVAVLGDVVDDDDPPHAHENREVVIAARATSRATLLRGTRAIGSDRDAIRTESCQTLMAGR